MSQKPTLSLWAAIFININIMFGTGIFINTVNLAHLTGILGFVTYGLVALLILPLIFSIAALLKRYPSGGFYTYSAHDITPLAGFISAWSYFTGKLASAALLIHVFSSLIITIAPNLQHYTSAYALDIIILMLFSVLNMLNMKTGSSIMYTFIVLKLTPILFAIISGLYLYFHWSIPPDSFLWTGIPMAIPLVLYAFTGFEASCSLSRSIINPQKNAPKAVLYSFGFVVIITIIYQAMVFFSLGSMIMNLTNYLQLFPTLLNVLSNHALWGKHWANLLHIALATSSLGGSYGILFSNHWNLYTLAQHKHIPGSTLLTRLNKHHIPIACVLVETILCLLYLLCTHYNTTQLQQISVLGCTISYTLSIIGMLMVSHKKPIFINTYVVWAALGSCCLLITACLRNFIIGGLTSLFLFGSLLIVGLVFYKITSIVKIRN